MLAALSQTHIFWSHSRAGIFLLTAFYLPFTTFLCALFPHRGSKTSACFGGSSFRLTDARGGPYLLAMSCRICMRNFPRPFRRTLLSSCTS